MILIDHGNHAQHQMFHHELFQCNTSSMKDKTKNF
jgi:hypothetical protein